MGTIIRYGDCYTHETIAFTGVAVGLTTTKLALSAGVTGPGKGQLARYALLNLESTDARVHMDGTTPAPSCGIVWVTGDYLLLEGQAAMRNFKVVGTASAQGTAVVQYFF